MLVDVSPGRWEETLDREIIRLVAEGHPGLIRAPLRTAVAGKASSKRSGRTVETTQLRTEFFESIKSSMTLPADVLDESGELLLSAGSRLTTEFLRLLRERGLNKVRLRLPEESASDATDEAEAIAPDELHTPHSRQLDERLAGELQRSVIFHPVKAWRRPRLAIDDLKEEAGRGVEKHAATSAVVADLCDALKAGRRMSAPDLHRSVAHFVDKATVDFDLLPLIVAMQTSDDEYLYDHCVNVALISMSIASQLGLDRESISVIGLGGMLHDIGMLRVPKSIRLGQAELGEREWHEIHRHPLHSLDMLADLRGLPSAVRFMVYQAHERVDGKGYPRGRAGGQLHQFAQILALADVYAAMTRARPYRTPLSPYEATRTILNDGAADRYDRRLVRALLDTVSLFPIGSRVELSDGSLARVLRATPGMHTRPVVEEVASDGVPIGHIIDLSEENAPRIVRVA